MTSAFNQVNGDKFIIFIFMINVFRFIITFCSFLGQTQNRKCSTQKTLQEVNTNLALPAKSRLSGSSSIQNQVKLLGTGVTLNKSPSRISVTNFYKDKLTIPLKKMNSVDS